MQLCGRWFPAAEKPRRTANSRSPSLQPINFPDFFLAENFADASSCSRIESIQIKICVGHKKSRLLLSVEPVVATLAFIGHSPIENWDALPYSRWSVPGR